MLSFSRLSSATDPRNVIWTRKKECSRNYRDWAAGYQGVWCCKDNILSIITLISANRKK